MRRFAIAAMAATIGLSAPRSGRADFQWVGDWQYGTSTVGKTTTGSPSADSASGSAEASVGYNSSIDPSPPPPQTAGVGFQREFSITGSPGGWQIDLNADFSGTNSGLHGMGQSTFSAYVLGASGELFSSHGGGGGGTGSGFSEMPSISYLLPDGIYSVAGELDEIASLAPDQFLGEFNFADATGSFDLSLTARAVPEPASASLIGLGAAGMAVASRRRPRVGALDQKRPNE